MSRPLSPQMLKFLFMLGFANEGFSDTYDPESLAWWNESTVCALIRRDLMGRNEFDGRVWITDDGEAELIRLGLAVRTDNGGTPCLERSVPPGLMDAALRKVWHCHKPIWWADIRARGAIMDRLISGTTTDADRIEVGGVLFRMERR